MPVPSEKTLDRALERAFREKEGFAQWFLSLTKFADLQANYEWSRSNNPWGVVTVQVENPATGQPETISREGETDVLLVFKVRDGRRVALHIEDKLATGRFTPFQPELYAARAASWKNNSKYGNYVDWETVLVAPKSFYQRYPVESSKFDRFVAHEDIAVHVPEFRQGE